MYYITYYIISLHCTTILEHAIRSHYIYSSHTWHGKITMPGCMMHYTFVETLGSHENYRSTRTRFALTQQCSRVCQAMPADKLERKTERAGIRGERLKKKVATLWDFERKVGDADIRFEPTCPAARHGAPKNWSRDRTTYKVH